MMRLDLSRIRVALENQGQSAVDLSDLHVTYLRPGQDGPVLAQLTSTQRDGGLATFTLRSASEVKGRRWAAEINTRHVANLNVVTATPAVYDEGLEALITSFPVDRRLSTLSDVLDEGVMRRKLADHFATRGHGDPLEACRASVIRYKSESKCVVRYELNWRSRSENRPDVLYGKLSKPSIFARSRAVADHVAEIGCATDFATPRWFGAIDSLSLELWGELTGVPLADAELGEAVPVAASVGRALRSLHSMKANLADARPDDCIELSLTEATHHLSKHVPELASELTAMREQTAPFLEWSRSHPPSPTHHDFHGFNLLIDGATVGLLDFEDLALGDRFHDVGALLAHFVELESRSSGPTVQFEQQRAGFLAGYGELDSAESDRLAAYAAAHCVLRGFQALRKPGFTNHEVVATLIRVARQFLRGENP